MKLHPNLKATLHEDGILIKKKNKTSDFNYCIAILEDIYENIDIYTKINFKSKGENNIVGFLNSKKKEQIQ